MPNEPVLTAHGRTLCSVQLLSTIPHQSSTLQHSRQPASVLQLQDVQAQQAEAAVRHEQQHSRLDCPPHCTHPALRYSRLQRRCPLPLGYQDPYDPRNQYLTYLGSPTPIHFFSPTPPANIPLRRERAAGATPAVRPVASAQSHWSALPDLCL